VPRLLAITVAGPALTLIAMAVAIGGGMLVAAATLDMPIGAFWERITERVELADFVHGLGKSFVFAWVVGFSGAHFGLRARADASSVGEATTRSVVAGISMIVVVDAIFASVDMVGV
jgi:phospholipid/cholesterol/gamma-HCH transport system permease protein